MLNERINKKPIGFTELKSWLRHRHPMILLDRIIDHEPGEFLIARVNVSGSMDCIAGHFPERAIFPGSHLIQAYSQCGIILFQMCSSKLADDELTVIGATEARFFKVIVPGDTIHLQVKVDRIFKNTFHFSGVALVEGQRVAAFRANLARIKVSDIGTEVLW